MHTPPPKTPGQRGRPAAKRCGATADSSFRRRTGPRRLRMALAVCSVCAAPLLPMAEAAEGDDAVGQLEPIEVVGRRRAESYHAAEVEGTKSSVPARETPQSVRVVTNQALKDRGAMRVDDVLDSVASVSRSNPFGGLWDNYTVRGLPGDENGGTGILLNGFPGNRGINAPRDLAGVERIEFLRGPAAALYGGSDPGGIMNIVSKRPGWTPQSTVEAWLGSYGRKRLSVDLTRQIGDRFAYRLNAAVEQGHTFRDYAGVRRQVIAPAFTWRLTPDTTLEYVGEWLHHHAPMDRGVTAINGDPGALPRSRFLGEPADGDMRIANLAHQLVLNHAWSAQWSSRVGLSYRKTALTGYVSEVAALRPDGYVTRDRRLRDYNSNDVTLNAELAGRMMAGGMDHDLVVGVETWRTALDWRAMRIPPTAAAPYALDTQAPVYGQPQPEPRPFSDTLTRQSGIALYAQDSVRVARDWRVLAGARFDHVRQTLDNRRTDLSSGSSPTAVSPRLGISWLPSPQWTVYASAGTSFRANSGVDASGNGFGPERGRTWELGTKWESADRRIGATAAVFDIRKRNVLTADPSNSGYSIAAGAMRSRGAEFDLVGQVTNHWRVGGNFAYLDAKIADDNTLEVGSRVLNVPRTSAGASAMYEDLLSNGQRYGLGGGISYGGRRLGQARTQAEARSGVAPFELPSCVTGRVNAWWQASSAIRVMLNVDNVANARCYPSSYSRLWVTPGAPRTIMLGVRATM